MNQTKKKIAILGGGMSALTAAHELTDYDGWQEKYEITVYQTGWRLGGKTATGRGKCDRIEEHGIHILQGWYDTTFRLLRGVYDERKAKHLAPDSPLQDLFKDGLQRNNTTLLTEFDPQLGKWVNWPLIFPELPDLPGDKGPQPTWELIQKGLGLMLEIFLGSPYQKNINPLVRWILDHFFPEYKGEGEWTTPKNTWLGRALNFFKGTVEQIEKDLPKGYTDLIHAFHLSNQKVTDNHHEHHSKILDALEAFIKKIGGKMEQTMEKDPTLRHLLLMLNFAYFNLKGILADVYDPQTGKFDFHKINNLDYREWLGKQGAPAWVRHSVIVRFFYTGTFANLVNDHGGSIGAGSALMVFTNSIGYKGSFVFQFVYGTGDTMVMPMYEVLKNRGVIFKFFQTVEQVHYSESGSIESISIAEQVKLATTSYDPVYKIGTLSTWPTEPLYDQIDPEWVAKLKEGHINLEDPWANWQNYQQQTLTKGVDFDEIILGIPVGTLKTICSEIIAQKHDWKQMVDQVKTTPTQSAQLWFLPTLEDLGFERDDWGLPVKNGAPNVVVYQNPMYSWLDSSLVLPHEKWPLQQTPRFLAYFTGPMPLRKPLPPFSDHGYQEIENQRLIDAFEQWLLDNSGFFWPAGTTLQYPQGLDFNLLADPHDSEEGYDRLASQFFRANVRPTDHYTLSVPKSENFRLKTDKSGFENLYLTGDWIDFGTNVGYIDGAIQSGQQAAQALRTKMGLGGHKEIWSKLPD